MSKQVEPNVRYCQRIKIRNQSAHARRIRVEPPVSRELRVVVENELAIAPGMAVSVDVEILSRNPQDYKDRLVVKACDGFRRVLEITSKQPSADIRFADCVNFDTVTTHRPHTQDFILTNVGATEGSFSISCNNEMLRFNPPQATLSPGGEVGSQIMVRCELHAPEPTTINEAVEIQLQGVSTLEPSLRTLQVYAQSVPQKLVFMVDEIETNAVNFDEVYQGHFHTQKAYLVNTGPTMVPFNISVLKADPDEATQDGEPKAELPMTVTPFLGNVPAFSKIPVNIDFAPPLVDETTGFANNRDFQAQQRSYDCIARIEVEELNQITDINVSGKGVRADLTFKPDILQFFDCPVNSHKDIILTLTNNQPAKDCHFNIPRMPNFSVTPSSGVILPMTTCDVRVTFVPRAFLRQIDWKLKLDYGSDATCQFTHHIEMHGSADVMGEKNFPKRGLEVTHHDFERPTNFVKTDEVMALTKGSRSVSKRMRSIQEFTTVSAESVQRLMFDLTDPNVHALSPSALQEWMKNREKYNSILRDGPKLRRRAAEEARRLKDPIDIFYEKDENIGLKSGSGLKSPRLKLDDVELEKLWLLRAVDDEGGTKGVTGMRFIPDETKPIKKKFKPAPTTQAEVRDCSTKLENAQLALCSAGPKVLDFGKVFVRSKVTKNFSIFNDLPSSILVALSDESLSEELAMTNPRSQVVPSAQPAGFDITLSHHLPQSFLRLVSYTINGHHLFKFTVKAEITLVELQLNRADLKFRFEEDYLERTMSKNVVMTNPGNAPANFNWNTIPGFTVQPSEGQVPAGGATICDVIFAPPNSGGLVDGKLVLKIEDGAEQTLQVDGQVDESAAMFTAKSIHCGTMAVGASPVTKTIGLQNTGQNSTCFFVDSVPAGVTVSPTRGRLSVGEKIDLNIHMCLDRPTRLDSVIQVWIRGGKPVRIPIRGAAVVPDIVIDEDGFEFGQLTLGASVTLPMNLRNLSAVEGTLYVDLQAHPDFTVTLPDISQMKNIPTGPDGLPDEAAAAQEMMNALVPISQAEYLDATGDGDGSPGDLAGEIAGDLAAMQGGGEGMEDTEEEAAASIWKINVQPGGELRFNLRYAPTEMAQHYFELPIHAAGGASTKSEGLRKVVHAEALRPRLLFSNSIIDFKSKVVASAVGGAPSSGASGMSAGGGGGGAASVASVVEFTLSNADESPIAWKIDLEPLKAHTGVFHIEPSSGQLDPQNDVVVRAAFLPQESMPYHATLDVFVSNSGDGDGDDLQVNLDHPYLELVLKGNGTVPKLAFDRKDIALPVVPLGVKSRCVFQVINEGYEQLEIKHRLPADKERIPLNITYPEGNLVGTTKTKLPVEVWFQSNKAVSFSAKIEFIDNSGKIYSIGVNGISDNSICSTFPYLYHASEYYTLGGEPVQLHEREEPSSHADNTTVKTSSASPSSSIGYRITEQAQDFLVRWLNSCVLKLPIERFPLDLINSNGRHIYDMVELFSGKPVPKVAEGGATGSQESEGKGGKGKGKGGKDAPAAAAPAVEETQEGASPRGLRSREMQRVQMQVATYEQLLTHLKQYGALLCSVKPEHFLSLDMFHKYMQHQYPGMSRKACDKIFVFKSPDAWVSVITQLVKIFILNRITPKVFRNLPGMIDGDALEIEEGGTTAANGQPPSAFLQNCLDPRGLADSNVYSVHENILLRWMNFHFSKANTKEKYGPARVIRTFDADLQDGVVLGAIIAQHCPGATSVMTMKYPCTNEEQTQQNAARIITAIQECELQFPIQPSDIANPQPFDMMLFVMFLFQNLPHYLPKASINFSTMLGQNLTKNIEMSNPSKKPITYQIHMAGSSDFQVKDGSETVRIEPRKSVNVGVEFVSRFSRSAEGQVTFTSRREGNVQAAAIVFRLKSKCAGSKPRVSRSITSTVYDPRTMELEIDNPFNDDAEFEVKLENSLIESHEDRTVRKSSLAAPLPAFHSSANKVKVKAGSSSKVTLTFLPFELATFLCNISVYDSRVGEYQLEVVGTSEMSSASLDSYKLTAKSGETGVKEIQVPTRNPTFDKARAAFENPKGLNAGKVAQLPDVVEYKVSLSSPYYKAQESVQVAMVKGGKAKGGDDQAILNKLMLEFLPKEPGIFPCTIKLVSNVDTRIYTVEGTGTAPNTLAQLTFETTARESITQDIPIVNNTDNDWVIKAQFLIGAEEFTCPMDFIAKKKGAAGATTSFFPLTFSPKWVCDVQCHLMLNNATTNEAYEYEMSGTAEEPAAEDHVTIRCKARDPTSHKFKVKNFSSEMATFEVESDLLHISGPPTIDVKGGSSEEEYELKIQPLQTGSVTGCVVFRDVQTGHFTWYTILIETSSPDAQQKLSLNCVVRQAIAVDIQLKNPIDDVVVFNVNLNGDGLLGENEFVLAPKETATYELVFSPLLPSKKTGTLFFVNDKVGEFWYELDLNAEKCPPEVVPRMACELGRSQRTQITIDNPTGQEINLKHKSTNKLNFKVVENRVVLPPLESATFSVEYTPSSLWEPNNPHSVPEEAQIIMEHPACGAWVFELQGVGQAPKEAEKINVISQVNKPSSSTIMFKNPFLEATTVLVVMESSAEKGVFSLLTKKARLNVGPLGTAQIPFAFCPTRMAQMQADVFVTTLKPQLYVFYVL